jgi:ADP-heptose:LPS heptosyltransferase
VKIIDPMWLKYKKTFFLTRWLSALGLLLMVNKGKYDMVIGLRWQDRLTSLILSLCNAKDKYGYDTGGMGFGINHKIPMLSHNAHVIDRNMEVLKQMLPGRKFVVKLGCSVDKAQKKVKGRYIVIHPVSGCPAKDWPIEKYGELAKYLAKKMPVYIIGTPTDTGIKTICGKNIHNTAGELSIRGIATLIKGASLVIGNDSAAVHIASAFDVKSLTLFSGSALYEEWGAYGKNSYIMTKDVICRECELAVCDKKGHECMEFEVKEVERQAYRILAGKQKKKIVER